MYFAIPTEKEIDLEVELKLTMESNHSKVPILIV